MVAASPPSLDPRLLSLAIGEVVAFTALVDHGGFTAAARALHLSQPGVSARIRRLERALGVALVDRSFRRLTLTAEGAAFLPEARRVLAGLRDGADRARRARRC